MLLRGLADPLNPEHFTPYFQQLYWGKGDGLDRHAVLTDLKPNRDLEFSFRSAARKFRIIDDSSQAPVIVRFGESPEFIEQLRRIGPERWLMRKLQRYVVNLPRYRHEQLLNSGDIVQIHPGLYVQAFDGLYHPALGLLGDDPAYHDPESLIL
jgi:CRISPR-associated endonuclease/helicase Cas3